MLAPKTELVEELSRLTRTPKPEVRQRIRSMFDKGIGPLRMEPLYDSVLADFLIGYLSVTHIDGADIAQHYGQLKLAGSGLSAIGNPEQPFKEIKPSVEDLEKLLPPLLSSSLRTVLARILRLIAEDAPLTVLYLQADLPPYDQFRIRLQPSGRVPVDLTYGPSAIVRKLEDSGADGWPIGTTRTMLGPVLPRLVHLSIPDTLRRKAAREPDAVRA